MKLKDHTQCAKDCDPHNSACEYGVQNFTLVFMHLKQYFNVCSLTFFLIPTIEELTQPTKHANRIVVLRFLTMKATILDAHGINGCDNGPLKHLDGWWAVDVSELGQKVEPVGGLTALGLEGPGDDDGSQEQEVKGE